MSPRLRTLALCACLLFPARAAEAHWFTWLDELSGPGPYAAPVVWSAEVLCLGRATVADLEKHEMPVDKALTALTESLKVATKGDKPEQLKSRVDELETTLEGLAKQLKKMKEELRKSGERLRVTPCGNDRAATFLSVALEFGAWDDRPTDYDGDTNLESLIAVVYFPLHRVLGTSETPNAVTRAIELGAGIGAYRLSGKSITQTEWWRGALAARVRVTCSELIPRIHKLPARWRRAAQSVQFAFGGDLLPGRFGSESFNGLTVDEDWDFVPSRTIQINVGAFIGAFFAKDK